MKSGQDKVFVYSLLQKNLS